MKKPLSVDPTLIRPPGPWRHLDVSAGGQRFHLVEMGPAGASRLVLLLHGFPQYWWAWRDVLPRIARAGWRVAAMDMRGFGGSDKPPSDYLLTTLASDTLHVAQALGASEVLVVGHGQGGSVAWACPQAAQVLPGLKSDSSPSSLIKGIATLGAPHPLGLRSLRSRLFTGAAFQYGLFQLPFFPQRALMNGTLVHGLLKSWAGEHYRDRVLSQASRYAQVLQRPLAAEAALAQIRGSRRFKSSERALLKVPVHVPVLSLQGKVDPIMPAQNYARDGHYVQGSIQQQTLEKCGHFLPEEQPEEVSRTLLEFIEKVFTSTEKD